MTIPQQMPLEEPIGLSGQEIARLSQIADKEAGISLGPAKTDFLNARISRRVKELGLSSFAEYCGLLEGSSRSTEVQNFLEAIATHTTSFFRESKHYDWLTTDGFEILNSLGAGIRRDLVFWSAACSSGQELYTAMIVSDAARKTTRSSMRFKGIGTDLSRAMVNGARNAIYSEDEISGIPREMRPSVLLSSKNGDGRCRIVPGLRECTEWRVGNLTKPETLSGIEADVVFLRNVLIYFDEETQAQVMTNVLSRLRPGGVLMTGHSETAQARRNGLSTIRPTIYRKDMP